MNVDVEQPRSASPAAAPAARAAGALPPFLVLRSRFMRRTALSILVTLVLVALVAATYFHAALWAGQYLASGAWMLGFLGLTPLIIKALLFDGDVLRGIALVMVKMVLLGLMFAALWYWTRGTYDKLAFGSAIVSGGVTPFVVVLLRALGGAKADGEPAMISGGQSTSGGVRA